MADTGPAWRGTSGGEALGYAFTMVASTVLFLYGGKMVDGWVGSEPLFAVLGAMVGAGAGIYYMVVRLSRTGEPPGDGER
jgi:F0F1-type ATP synthase assembly protein I